MGQRVSALVFGFALLGACGDADPYSYGAGAPCRDDFDCPPGASCEHKGQGGDCLFDCRDFRDCGPGWACVSSHGDTCHPLCASDRDCRPGLECKRKDNHGSGGSSNVCEP